MILDNNYLKISDFSTVGYTRFFNRVHPVTQSGALSYSIGCTQLFNRVHSVAQSGALTLQLLPAKEQPFPRTKKVLAFFLYDPFRGRPPFLPFLLFMADKIAGSFRAHELRLCR